MSDVPLTGDWAERLRQEHFPEREAPSVDQIRAGAIRALVNHYIYDGIPATFEPKPYRTPASYFDADDNTYRIESVTSVGEIVADMLRQIRAAEEGIREEVMVAWLREHGWTVTKEGS